jgi:hypothetical protein
MPSSTASGSITSVVRVPISRPGAYALQRQVEHVLADLVGAEDVVAAAERNRDAEQQQDRQQRENHGTNRRPAGADFQHFDHFDAAQPAPRDNQQQPDREAAGTAARDAHGDVELVAGQIRAQMRAAMLQARELALRRIRQRLLGIQMRRQRRRVGLLAALAQVGEQRIERRMHFDGVAHRRSGRRARLRIEPGAVMQRIEQADHDEGRQHRRRGHRHAVPCHAPPGRAQASWRRAQSMRPMMAAISTKSSASDQSTTTWKLIAAAPADRRACRRCRSAAGRRCRAPSR